MQVSTYIILSFLVLALKAVEAKLGTEICTLPQFPHGKVYYSVKTGILSFKCRKKFRLLGEPESLCEKGKVWNSVPFCAKAGCSTKINSHHGLIVHNEQGLRMSFTCAKEDHELIGSRILACDGDSWNGSIPFCRRRSFNLSPECIPGACPDWKSFGFQVGVDTPSRGTGPLMPESKPFYYLESSNKGLAYFESEEMETDKVACLRLEYLMRGATMGFIKVSQVYDNLRPSTLLKISDEQGNEWKSITLLIKNPVEGGVPFYIKIAAVRGNGYLSDIAIRKIQVLRSKEDCSIEKDDPIRHPVRQISPSSCYDRCHTNVSTFKALWTEGICSCDFPKCGGAELCCSDVYEECNEKIHDDASKDSHSKDAASGSGDYYNSLALTGGLFLLALVLAIFFVYRFCPLFKEGVESPFNVASQIPDFRSIVSKHSTEDVPIIIQGLPSAILNEEENPPDAQGIFGSSCTSLEPPKEVFLPSS